MSIMPDQNSASRSRLSYGARVMIRDGTDLDGKEGIVFRVKDGIVQVLLDREVFWLVAERHVERL